MTLGSRIAALRAETGLSQEELAQRLEVSRQSVSKWETDASVPELDKLLRLSELFGVSLDSLVKDAQPQPEASGQPPQPTQSLLAMWRENPRVILGSALVLFGAVMALIFSLRGERLLITLMVGLPIIGCGVICMLVKKRPLLWCGWYLWLGYALCCTFLWFFPYSIYTRVPSLALLILLFATGWSFRNSLPKTVRGRLRLVLACLGLALLWWTLRRVGFHYYGVINVQLSHAENERRWFLGECLLTLGLIPLFTLISTVFATLMHTAGWLGRRIARGVSSWLEKEAS